eukprot:m.177969 g.177969  ORF g.177969 m.177969 type:complete len:149 (+) comp15463_c0_seq2:206-652(+)
MAIRFLSLAVSLSTVTALLEENPCLADNNTYTTHGNLFIIGRAIAVNLSDVENLPYDPKCITQPHNTLLYRSKGYTKDDLALVSEARDEYMRGKGLKMLNFTLSVWKQWPDSDLIYGDLREMWDYMQDKFKNMNANDRDCHTAMRCPN